MSKMLIQGGVYSWLELIDFFIKNLVKAERCIKREGEDNSMSSEEIQRDISIAENSIEAIAVFV
jgi:hypothetical protein